MGEETHGVRLDRVEVEVSTISKDMAGLKSDVRSLASILHRIEDGVASAQQRFENDKQASRLNPMALATVLITIISILVGGAWLVGGTQARLDERSIHQQRALDRMEQRQWEGRKGGGPANAAPPSG